MIRHLVMKYLTQIPLVHSLPAPFACIEVLRFAGGFATHAISDDLPRLDLLSCGSDHPIVSALSDPRH